MEKLIYEDNWGYHCYSTDTKTTFDHISNVYIKEKDGLKRFKVEASVDLQIVNDMGRTEKVYSKQYSIKVPVFGKKLKVSLNQLMKLGLKIYVK